MRIVRWSFIVAAGCVLVIALGLTALFLVQPKRYQAFIEQQIISSAQQNGIGVRIGGSELTPWHFIAHNVRIAVPRAFLFFDIDSIEVLPVFSSLLSGVPLVKLQAKFYGGSVNADTSFAPSAGSVQTTVDVHNVALATHPVLAGVGFRSGTLTAQLSEALLDSHGLRQARFMLSISDGEKPQATSFALGSFGVPLNIELPAFSGLNLDATGSLQRPVVSIKHMTLESSLGNARFTGEGRLDERGRLASWSMDGTVELSQEGHARFGQWVVLMSNGSLDENVRRFRVSAKAAGGPPIAKFSRY